MIVTFYSFKGGVGRTMALASVGTILSRSHRVLMVDWDLEAPGLPAWFDAPGVHWEAPACHDGLLGLIAELAVSMGCDSGGIREACRKRVEHIRVGPDARIDLIRASGPEPRASSAWSGAWSDLYSKFEGFRLVEALRDEWESGYDYVLIDSRTGFGDIGGICTVQLPDIIVAICAPNHQNVEGLANVLREVDIKRSSGGFSRPAVTVVPVLSRVDPDADFADLAYWLGEFQRGFLHCLLQWPMSEQAARDLLRGLVLPYLHGLSTGETLAGRAGAERTALQAAYERLAEVLRFESFSDEEPRQESVPVQIAVSWPNDGALRLHRQEMEEVWDRLAHLLHASPQPSNVVGLRTCEARVLVYIDGGPPERKAAWQSFDAERRIGLRTAHAPWGDLTDIEAFATLGAPGNADLIALRLGALLLPPTTEVDLSPPGPEDTFSFYGKLLCALQDDGADAAAVATLRGMIGTLGEVGRVDVHRATLAHLRPKGLDQGADVASVGLEAVRQHFLGLVEYTCIGDRRRSDAALLRSERHWRRVAEALSGTAVPGSSERIRSLLEVLRARADGNLLLNEFFSFLARRFRDRLRSSLWGFPSSRDAAELLFTAADGGGIYRDGAVYLAPVLVDVARMDPALQILGRRSGLEDAVGFFRAEFTRERAVFLDQGELGATTAGGRAAFICACDVLCPGGEGPPPEEAEALAWLLGEGALKEGAGHPNSLSAVLVRNLAGRMQRDWWPAELALLLAAVFHRWMSHHELSRGAAE